MAGKSVVNADEQADLGRDNDRYAVTAQSLKTHNASSGSDPIFDIGKVRPRVAAIGRTAKDEA